MNIYAIRDRLIDYFMTPWAAESDQHALGGIAYQVNGETKSAISQAPHHFEIWKLAEIDDKGNATPAKEFLADCNSLIRAGVRKDPVPGAGAPDSQQIESTGEPGGDRTHAGTQGAPVRPSPLTAPLARKTPNRTAKRGNRKPKQ